MHNRTKIILQFMVVTLFLVLYGVYVNKYLTDNDFSPFANFLNNNQKPTGIIVGTKPQITQLDIPIVIYHYVEIVTDERDFIRKSLAVTPNTFEQEIQYFNNKKYQSVFVKDIPEMFNNAATKIEKPYALTFDDGYQDFYTDVFPILKRNNTKATVYVVAGFIGANKNYMTKDQITEVINSGLVEVGCHGVGHYEITSVSAEDAKKELSACKTILDDTFKIDVKTYAYPYGRYNQTTADIIKNVGFTAAVTEIDGVNQKRENMFILSRIKPGEITKLVP